VYTRALRLQKSPIWVQKGPKSERASTGDLGCLQIREYSLFVVLLYLFFGDMWVFVCVYLCLCGWVGASLCRYIHVYVCLNDIRMYVYVNVHIYAYVYICT